MFPIEVKVKRVELTLPPKEIELSPARLAELEAALWGKQPRGAKQPSAGEQRARAQSEVVVDSRGLIVESLMNSE